jgi:hypothetical protein
VWEPEPDDPLPAAVLFRPERCRQGHLWAWPGDVLDPRRVDPVGPGLSERLRDGLEEWYGSAHSTGVPTDTGRGLALASELQQELVAGGLDVEVVRGMDEVPVPVRERRAADPRQASASTARRAPRMQAGTPTPS